MEAFLRPFDLARISRGWRDRRAIRAALLRAQEEASLETIGRALALATGQPSEADRSEFAAVERRRAWLLASNEFVQQLDFGAGARGRLESAESQRHGVVRTLTVRDLAESSSGAQWGEFLYYITRAARPRAVLELGSCVGIGAGYIAAALQRNGSGHLWTLEGSPPSARIAGETLSELGRGERATIVLGQFSDTLADCLEAHGPFDLAFIDGHHDGEATLGYYRQIRRHAAPGAILIFDDLHFSASMEAVWREISADADTRAHLRIRARGLVVV